MKDKKEPETLLCIKINNDPHQLDSKHVSDVRLKQRLQYSEKAFMTSFPIFAGDNLFKYFPFDIEE